MRKLVGNYALQFCSVQTLQQTGSGHYYRVLGITTGSKSIGGRIVNHIDSGHRQPGRQAEIFRYRVKIKKLPLIGRLSTSREQHDLIGIEIAPNGRNQGYQNSGNQIALSRTHKLTHQIKESGNYHYK